MWFESNQEYLLSRPIWKYLVVFAKGSITIITAHDFEGSGLQPVTLRTKLSLVSGHEMIIDIFFFKCKKYSTFGNWFCAVSGTEIPHCSFQHNLFLQLFLFPFLLSDCLIWPEKDTREWQVKKLLVCDDYNICDSWWQYLANTETKTVIQSSISCTRNILFRVTKIMFDINRIQSNFGGPTRRQIL